MPDRYFLEQPPQGDAATLIGGEAQHLAQVMRAAVGDEVLLFDGSGVEFTAQVTKVGKQKVELRVLARREIERERAWPLIVGVSLPKGDRQKWLVEKAVEVGITRLVPLFTRRSVAQPVENALARLRRQVLEATKQCGRTRLMEIGEPLSWEQFLAAAPRDAMRWVAHPTEPATEVPQREPRATWCGIGPEGGFTDDEIAQARAAEWQVIGLGPRILRVETAVIVIAARCP